MKPDIKVGYIRFVTCGHYPKRKTNDNGSNEMHASGWMVSPSIMQLNVSQRRLSHETELDPTKSLHEEIEYSIQFNRHGARHDCETGFAGPSLDGRLVVLEEEEEEEVKDNSGENELSPSITFLED